jgi:peptide/nickel transport system substrate-binding protein
MKRLRWQILVVILTLVVVGVLLLTQQPVGPVQISPQPATGGVYSEALVGSLGRLNPLLDWNNQADRDERRLARWDPSHQRRCHLHNRAA